jgi:hypothetical protein
MSRQGAKGRQEVNVVGLLFSTTSLFRPGRLPTCPFHFPREWLTIA